MHINFSKTRQYFVFSAYLALFAFISSRLIYIQIIRNTFFVDLAKDQQKMYATLSPRRGNLYDNMNRILAVYLDVSSIYAVPKEIIDKEKTARILADELVLNESVLLERLKRDNYFAWIDRKVSEDEAQRISELNVKGVYLTREARRFYPGGRLGCHVIGIAGVDNVGLEGLEFYYDKELKGEDGWKRTFRDAKRRELILSNDDMLPAKDGNSLVLTIDSVVQHIIETEIDELVKTYRPNGVTIIAINPATGELMGLAGYPYFDPNDIKRRDAKKVKNRAITDVFEPGSVFKIVTASAALEERAVDFGTIIDCKQGKYKIGRRILKDYRPYGEITFRRVIERSSNIGTVKVADKIGKKKLYTYIKRFNFGEKTGVDLPGESQGIVRKPKDWSYVDMTTVPMGQGIAVTAMQLAASVSVIANNGVLMKPHMVKRILNEEGKIIKEAKPMAIRRVISKDTAIKVKELMRGVVERGTGTRAKLDNFVASGKTGTAEKVRPNGGYYKNKYIASFIGFAPYENPVACVVICVDDPKGKHFGGHVSAPAFKNIMEKILSYLEVKGDRSET